MGSKHGVSKSPTLNSYVTSNHKVFSEEKEVNKYLVYKCLPQNLRSQETPHLSLWVCTVCSLCDSDEGAEVFEGRGESHISNITLKFHSHYSYSKKKGRKEGEKEIKSIYTGKEKNITASIFK